MKPSRLNNILDRDAPHNRLLTPTIPHTHIHDIRMTTVRVARSLARRSRIAKGKSKDHESAAVRKLVISLMRARAEIDSR